MRLFRRTLGATAVLFAFAWLLPAFIGSGVQEASALSQFARRYGISCTACHTAFPRLNDFGEKFKLNGFQMPDSTDGDDKGQQVGDNLTVQNLGDLFGLRIAVSPLTVKTDSLTIEGEKRNQVDIGKADWLQLFTAGSLFKNVSLLIETEITDSTIKNNWFYLGFHNLLGTKNGELNARVGKIPQADMHVASGRLRMIPNINVESLSAINSAGGGTGNEDQVPVSSAQPGLEVFGLKGALIYSAGLTNGKNATDLNQDKNYFATLGLRVPDGDWAGSQVSIFGLRGTDTKNSSFTVTNGGQLRDNFTRISPGVNLRRGGSDLIVAWVFAKDDNWTLVSGNKQEINATGVSAQFGQLFAKNKWYGSLQYDKIDTSDAAAKALRYEKISPSLWYFVRDNMRAGLTVRVDIEPKNTTASHANRIDEYLLHIRSMF